MCLILVAWRSHPDYPLVVAANRDEFFARPSSPAAFWQEAPDVLAGKDLQAGGSWMGMTRSGRFAALTNFRDPGSQRPDAVSRGLLVAGFLRGRVPAADYLEAVSRRGHDFNGFNLLAGDGENLGWYSNVPGAAPLLLEPGIYGVCNHLLDTPWPKVRAAKSALGEALGELPGDAALFRLLRDDTIHPDESLPRTGVSLEWERLLSAAFVRAGGYGTRNSTVCRIGRDDWIVFDEQTWLEGGAAGPRRRYRFRRAGAPS